MRTDIIEREVFAWHELDDEARERIAQRQGQWAWEDGIAQENMESIAEHVLGELGWSDVKLIEYSLYSQGGMPVWTGRWEGRSRVSHRRAFILIQGTRKPLTVDYGNVWRHGSEHLERSTENGDDFSQARGLEVRDRVEEAQRKLYDAMVAEDEYLSSVEAAAELFDDGVERWTANGDLA